MRKEPEVVTASDVADTLESIHDWDITLLTNLWFSGKHERVVENLAVRHPAITALFIHELQNHPATHNDLRRIANMLMDDLTTIRDKFGIAALEPPHLTLRKRG